VQDETVSPVLKASGPTKHVKAKCDRLHLSFDFNFNLRHYNQEAQVALAELPGVGPKVAACVCLFALDKHQAGGSLRTNIST